MRKLFLFLLSHRTLALLRWDLHFLRVRLNNFLFNKEARLKKIVEKKPGLKYLNLGSGPRGLMDASWVNIDGYKDTNVHFLCDFNRRLPFASETFDGIFCEHVLEHFDYQGGRKLLVECLRILKKGGVIRVIVPDGEKFIKAYFDDPGQILKYKECSTEFPIEAVNAWFYQRYEHQCIYDAAYLIDQLKKAGFANAVKSSYKNSSLGAVAIALDDPKYAWESLYVDAVKSPAFNEGFEN
jgi:predicted SAM-dependent methyltransferase